MEGYITLQSKEGKLYKLKKTAAKLSQLLAQFEDIKEEIPPFLVSGSESISIEKIVEYLEHFNGKIPKEIQKPLQSTEMKNITDEWSAEFIDKLSVKELANLIYTSHFLQISCLVDLGCAKMVSLCKGKSEAEIYKVFGVPPNHFTEEKKKQSKEMNSWVEDLFK